MMCAARPISARWRRAACQLTALAVGIVHMVDGAEINLRVRRLQSLERREKRVVRSAERRQMQESARA